MIREIKKGTQIFNKKAKRATLKDIETGQDLLDTLIAHKDECVGMAANMIGINKAIIAISMSNVQYVMYNPRIIRKSGKYLTQEGCLSLDGMKNCMRYQEIDLEYNDANFKKVHAHFSGTIAQIIQHEIDHCNGIVI
ncbi:peptide deformylase [Sharpea azabuensis]|uniref:Peptide deformylase n=1 Tax=Sharpea azabuensis TaxID=322505 RepID=A0A1H6WRJ9_9FIRM|nr:peptide deformylase [Sharpea azabuensis]HAJ15559.1 peptide deformylase [Erysipelotrichaceae bacterium]MDD6512216.1 peptide deformylase [Sharpea azabuensis]MEE3308639.1 peptide deformylase [Sharpea azabuensis]SEJ19629.1 peptide deformylase [Sharpea azabuensis]SFE39585.1 peptide deformylase [Sharpea azabuensis]